MIANVGAAASEIQSAVGTEGCLSWLRFIASALRG
jgi:hypothetical protein